MERRHESATEADADECRRGCERKTPRRQFLQESMPPRDASCARLRRTRVRTYSRTIKYISMRVQTRAQQRSSRSARRVWLHERFQYCNIAILPAACSCVGRALLAASVYEWTTSLNHTADGTTRLRSLWKFSKHEVFVLYGWFFMCLYFSF